MKKRFLNNIGSVILIIVILFPFIWMLASSFKTSGEIMTSTKFFPDKFTIKNYYKLFHPKTPVRDFPQFIKNSFKVSLITTIFSTIISILGAYGLSNLELKPKITIGRSLLFIYLFPTSVILIPIYKMFANMGILNTHLSLIIMYIALTAPFTTWLLASFFDGIPNSLEEAAYVDGANWIQTLFKVIIPLVTPGIITIAAYTFIYSWGEYTFSLVLLTSSSLKTAPLGLATFTTEQYIEWGLLLSGSIIVSFPVILLFLPFAKKFASGLMSGAVKY